MTNLPPEAQEAVERAEKMEPWAWRPRADGSKFADGTRVCEVVSADRTIIAYDVGEPEARFIAAAREDIPMLAAGWAEDRAKLEKMERRLARHECICGGPPMQPCGSLCLYPHADGDPALGGSE